MKTKLGTIVAVAASGLSLGADATYAPAGAAQWNDGYRSVVFHRPANAPRGTVELASFGIVELTPDDTPAMPTLHVRLVVANTADAASWTFDARTLHLDVGDAHLRPTAVNSDLLTLPVGIVDPGHRAVVDLYFALPARSSAPHAFALAWQVKTPSGVFGEATAFDADATPSPSVFVARRAGWGSHWWFDPTFAWAEYVHAPGVAVPRPPTHVLVTRPPSRHAITSS